MNFKPSKVGWAALLVFFLAFTSSRLLAEEEELAASTKETDVEESDSEVGVGKFFKLPFHVSVSVRGGYDDNIAQQKFDRQGSAYVSGILGITYNFGSPRTQLSLASQIGYTDYLTDVQAGGQNVDFDFNPNLTFSLSHKVSARLTLALTSYFTYQQQPDFNNTTFGGLNRRSGNFFYTTNRISATFVWKPRFSTVTSYSLLGISYDESTVGIFEDRTEHLFGNEFRFLLWPTTSLVADYRLGIVAYEISGPQARDSITHYFLGGFDHSFSPRFTVSARGGLEIREYDNFGQNIAPYAEATLVYALGPHLSMSWVNRYSLEEPDVLGSPGRTTFRTGLNATYTLTKRINLALNAFWQHDDNDGQVSFFFVFPSFAEDVFSTSLSLRYALNRNWGLELGYDFANVSSDIPIREYYRHRGYGGVNFQF